MTVAPTPHVTPAAQFYESYPTYGKTDLGFYLGGANTNYPPAPGVGAASDLILITANMI